MSKGAIAQQILRRLYGAAREAEKSTLVETGKGGEAVGTNGRLDRGLDLPPLG
jgi:hypothetical protein